MSSSTQTKMFAQKFSDRFFNSGIAEQDMIITAAGLASQGKIPFVSTFAMFATGRTYDQIRNSICYPKFDVKIVATHGGVTVGEDGASHQALEDIALMRNLPNMTVIVPADYNECRQAIKYAVENEGSMYIRIPRINLPDIFDNSYKFTLTAKVVEKGDDISIISNGDTLIESIKAGQMIKEKGISAQIIHCPAVKPIDKKILNFVGGCKQRTLFTVENHSVIGGLGSAISELITDAGLGLKLVRIGINDEFGQSGTAEELLDYYGISAEKLLIRFLIKQNKNRRHYKNAINRQRKRNNAINTQIILTRSLPKNIRKER